MYDRDVNWQGQSDDFMGSCNLEMTLVPIYKTDFSVFTFSMYNTIAYIINQPEMPVSYFVISLGLASQQSPEDIRNEL